MVPSTQRVSGPVASTPLLLLLVTTLLGGLTHAQDYQAEVDEIAKATKQKLTMIESDNFVFVTGLNKTQTKPIVKAAEKAFDIWKDISGTTWRDMWGRKKAYMFVAKNKPQYRKLLKWYEKKYAPYPGFAQGAGPHNYFPISLPRPSAFMHAKPLSVKRLPMVAAHEVGHLVVWRYKWTGYFVPPWLEECMGIYLEARTFKRTQCYCFGGSYGDSSGSKEELTDIEWKKWKSQIQKLVRKRSDKDMKAILRLRHSQLGASEVGKGWSVIDFLVQKDKAAFAKFMRGVKSYWPKTVQPKPEYSKLKGEAQDKAMKAAFGWSMEEMDKEWRAWAKKGMKKPK